MFERLFTTLLHSAPAEMDILELLRYSKSVNVSPTEAIEYPLLFKELTISHLCLGEILEC